MRRLAGGFTFQVQPVCPEDLGGGLVAEALAGGVVGGLDHLPKAVVRQANEVGLAGQRPAQAADGVLDPALLPGGVGVAAAGGEAERLEAVMAGALGAVVEGDGLAPGGRQGRQELGQGGRDGGGGCAGRADGDEEPGVTRVHGEDRLAIGADEHQVGLPVAGGLAVRGGDGSVGQGAAVGDQGGGATAGAPAPAAFGRGAGQGVAPRVVLRAGALGIDEPVDGLVGHDRAAGLAGQPASDLLGGPALGEAGEDAVAQRRIPVEAGTAPAAGVGLLVGRAGLVALGA